MKNARLIIPGILLVMMIVSLIGCRITGATPNTSTPVVVKLGDSRIFSVVGPEAKDYGYKYVWWDSANGSHDGIGKQFTFVADPQKITSNKTTVVCYLYQWRFGLVFFNSFQDTPPPQLGWDWFLADKRVWNIRIVQDAPVWQGNYYIEDDTDLQSLKDFTTITGNLYIQSTELKSLAGLENLTSVGGYLGIGGNASLISLNGLNNLTSVGGHLSVSNNCTLKNLSGLENITSIGSLEIYNNASITSLCGIEGIISIGDLEIMNNAVLTSLSSLENITSIGRDVGISNNAALTNLSGLENITSIGRDLYIEDNDVLTSLSVLDNITSIAGRLEISYNDVLTSLSGLDNITSVGDSLGISGNPALINLNPLNKIKTVGSLIVNNNSSLNNLRLSDLSKVTQSHAFWGAFCINDNPSLCKNLAEELRDQVLSREGINGEVSINGNKECIMP
jgi:hypothetical protein